MKKMGLKLIHRVLLLEARKVIRQHKPFIIGITGSAGKSSTKEAIYQVLSDKYGDKVRKAYGNFNNELGVPLSILGYGQRKQPPGIFWPLFLIQAYFRTLSRDFPEYLVLELSADKPGDIAYFGQILRLDIAVITSISGAHLANFKNLDQYRREKLSIIKLVKDSGMVIINGDEIKKNDIDFENVISYGIKNQKNDFYAENIVPTLSGTEFRICGVGRKIAVKSAMPGRQFALSLLAAYAVGQKFSIQSLDIKKSLEKIKPLNGRVNILEGRDGTVLLDDTYNASPTSVLAALDLLAEIKYAGRKVAILGNMNEIGRDEKKTHFEIGEYSRDRADLAIFAGKNAQTMTDGRNDANSTRIYRSRRDIIDNLSNLIKPNDLILIKASQDENYFEEITKALLEKPETASEVLVRQNKLWLKKKRRS